MKSIIEVISDYSFTSYQSLDFDIARRDVESLYDRTLPLLAEKLINVHGYHISNKACEIILGPWLHQFLTVIYDRYNIAIDIIKANDVEYFAEPLIALPVPKDTQDFLYNSGGDEYNSILCSAIINSLTGIDGILCVDKVFFGMAKPQSSGLKFYLKRISSFVNVLQVRLLGWRAKGIGYSSYFHWKDEIKLFLKTWGKYLFIIPRLKEYPEVKINWALRKEFSNINWGTDDLSNLLKSIVPFAIPISLIENFHYIACEANKIPIMSSVELISADAWHYDEYFKFLAAKHLDSSGKLGVIQHGGTYGGIHNYVPHEKHELKIADIFYSWGWNAQSAKILPMPSPKLHRTKTEFQKFNVSKLLSSNLKPLYVGGAGFRFAFSYQTNISRYPDYFIAQKTFFDSLPRQIRELFLVRLFDQDFGWSKEFDLRVSRSELSFDTHSINLPSRLRSAPFCVIDHISTTWIEVLAVDKPLLMFDSGLNDLGENGKQILSLLEEVKIFHESAESAANFLTENFDHIEEWWASSEVRIVRSEILDRVGLTGENYLDLWAKRFA